MARKHKRISVKKTFHAWLPVAFGITFVFGILYVVVHQVIRQAANYPQIQMVQDAAHALSGGKSPTQVIPTQKIDIEESLAPFMIVYDDGGNVLASSAQLDGKTPMIPPGVLDYTREHVEDRITWEPASGVRMATIVMRFTDGSHGFVLAGRSLSEVEKRKEILLWQLAAAWLVTLTATFFVRHRV